MTLTRLDKGIAYSVLALACIAGGVSLYNESRQEDTSKITCRPLTLQERMDVLGQEARERQASSIGTNSLTYKIK